MNQKHYPRIIIVILDSVGCGTQEDFRRYHQLESNTLFDIYRKVKNFRLPNLEKMGLRQILFNKTPKWNYCAGTMMAQTSGNDTFAGIWEMFGVVIKPRFRSKEGGLDADILHEVEKKMKIKFVGNEFIAGIPAINKFYDAHQQTKGPILYFDKDGVALIAGHQQIISPRKLGQIGKTLAQHLMQYGVARVITRPFSGKLGNFKRTKGCYFSFVARKFIKRSILAELFTKKI